MSARDSIGALLKGLRDKELDCDEFLAHLPAWVEGNISDREVQELLEQHARLCPECEEERTVLKRALRPDG